MDPSVAAVITRLDTLVALEQRHAEALERIATALDRALPAETAPTSECLHPLEDRVDFGVTDGVEDWHCRRCSYRSVPVKESVGG